MILFIVDKAATISRRRNPLRSSSTRASKDEILFRVFSLRVYTDKHGKRSIDILESGFMGELE